MQPFPSLPAFTVAITLLKYAGTQTDVMQVLQRLSHTTRAFCYHHKSSLDSTLVLQCVNFKNNAAMHGIGNFNDNQLKEYEWPSKELFDKFNLSKKPVMLKSLTLNYSKHMYNHKDRVSQIRDNVEEVKDVNQFVVMGLQSIQVHLNNGMSSPAIPFHNENNNCGSEELMANSTECKHVHALWFKRTKIQRYNAFTSIQVEYDSNTVKHIAERS